MSEENYIVNEGKNEIIEVDGVKYQRLAIRTHVITDQDDVCDVIEKYAKPHARPDDIVFMTEKAVAELRKMRENIGEAELQTYRRNIRSL